MRKTIYFLMLLPVYSFSQKSVPRIVEWLLHSNRDIPVICGWMSNFIPDSEIPQQMRHELQYLVKARGNLYCGINGTAVYIK